MTERTMRSVSQRNPADPEHASADVFDRMFQRGPNAAADGGERGAGVEPEEGAEPAERADREEGADGEEQESAAGQKMKDVDQTPPDEDASPNRVWERGGETAPEAAETVDNE